MTTDKRAEPPLLGDERATLAGFLDYQRATVHLKAAGLSEEDAHRSVLPSPLMTVAGLVSHLRWVEAYWFDVVLNGNPDSAPYHEEDPDAEFRVPDVPLADLLADYAAQCETSRRITASVGLDAEFTFPGRPDRSARWVVVHMIEETARHAGHLDVIREFLDGSTGE